jgi:hypothetical protein
MFACLHEACLAGMASDLPSSSRWHTMSVHAAKQGLLLFTHRLLPRAASVALCGHDSKESKEDDGDGWAATASRRRRAVVDFLAEPAEAVKLFGSQPKLVQHEFST